MRSLCLALVAAAGCATSGSSQMSQSATAQRFTGDPYDIYDHGSRITGSVCGLNVEYSVSRSSDGAVRLSGFSDSRRPVNIEVKDEGDGRRVTGSLGTRVGVGEVDLFVSNDRIQGRSGVRSFDLAARGDELQGSMTALNTQGAVYAAVAGRGALTQLPDAAVGAILPPLLNCSAPFGKPSLRPSMTVRIGGPAGYETRYTNEIGRAR
jgi:hypothetical protein